jgi:hypothetical protein
MLGPDPTALIPHEEMPRIYELLEAISGTQWLAIV